MQQFQHRYPLDTLTGSSDYMQFQVVKYTPPGVRLANFGAEEIRRASQAGASFRDNTFRVRSSEDSISSSLRSRPKENSKGFVILPMPMQIGDRNEVAYNPGSLNALAAAAGSLLQTLSANPNMNLDANQLVTNARNAMSQVGGLVGGNMGGLATLGGDLATSLAINLIPGTNASFNDVLQRNRGVVVNPNMEFLFQGPKLRTFQFLFSFIPRSEREATEVKNILRVFKRHMAPKSNTTALGSNLAGGFLQTPDVFKIRYMSGSAQNPFLNKFKFCALTDMAVDYTAVGQGYMSYENGTPVATTITLQFTELSPVYAEDYDSEDGSTGVGF
jgi:hypothetical protein